MNFTNNLSNRFFGEIYATINRYTGLFERAISEKKIDGLWMDDIDQAAYKTLIEANLSTDEVQAIKHLLGSVSQGVVHSLFVSIDGGTALSDEGKALELIDRKNGQPLTNGALHEDFIDFVER